MKAVYFAWVRERIGLPDEEIAPPAEVATAGALITWLASRSDGHAHAFAEPAIIRIAIDKRHVQPEARLDGAREIAFFPPMTGG